jgi:40-residue YVTN family beta-propeller repeat
VANSGSGTLTIINAMTNGVVNNVPICADPRFIDIAPDGKVWVACFSSNTVAVFDPVTGTVIAVIPVGAGPNAVRINPAGTFAYVTNSLSNTVTVISTLSLPRLPPLP